MAKEKENKTTVFFNSWRTTLFEELTYEEIGKLTMALLAYSDGITEMPKEIEEDRVLRVLYKHMCELVQISINKYKETCERNSKAAQSRWNKAKEKEYDPNDESNFIIFENGDRIRKSSQTW